MSESGLLNLGDSFHLECLWFCFAKVIQADLDKVKDHWNSHSRHSRHDTVSGVPDVFFLLPEYSGATDCLVPLTQAQVDEIDQYCELKRQFFRSSAETHCKDVCCPSYEAKNTSKG